MPINETQIYSPDEIAKILRCDRHRVYAWCRCGWLKAFKVGPDSTRWLVTGRALLELIGKMQREEWPEGAEDWNYPDREKQDAERTYTPGTGRNGQMGMVRGRGQWNDQRRSGWE